MRTQYPYENLEWQEFERLVIELCHDLLGIAAKAFSDGKDGGRDSRFEGVAEKFPSTSDLWSGVFIIQAKHTRNPIASCSDKDFKDSLDEEIKRLKLLQKEDPFTNYLLFTNRKLTANQHTTLKNKLKKELSFSKTHIFGIEDLNVYLDKLPGLVQKFSLDQRGKALIFYEKDLKKVITTFHKHKETLTKGVQQSLDNITSLTNVNKERKNILNNLSKGYFTTIQNDSLAYFNQVKGFLEDPQNEILLKHYDDTTADLRAVISLRRSEFGPFEYVIEHLVESVFSSIERETSEESGLISIKRTIRLLLHFMYYHCDIGIKDDAKAA